MNYLAHISLSGEPSQLMIGNFIADFVKGKKVLEYSKEVQKGIVLHKKIDAYTDQHSVVKKASERLKENHGRYAPIIIDVFYDHFLAKNWGLYHEKTLLEFSKEVYSFFEKNPQHFPLKVQEFLPNMKHNNWLLNYGTMHGMERSLMGISRRAKFSHQLADAVSDLQKHYEIFDQEFQLFFPDIIDFVKSEKEKL